MSLLLRLLSDALNVLRLRQLASRVQLRAIRDETITAAGLAQAHPNDTGVRELQRTLAEETAWAFERLRFYVGGRLIEKAASLHVELPAARPPAGQDNEHWRFSSTTGTHLLTERGVADLRRAIRAEERERREAFLSWAPVVTGLVSALAGLGGVLIGLLAAGIIKVGR